MALATIQTAFTGGELSPQLYGRVDFAKFEVGAALLRNFFVDFRGGVANRPGTKFIADLSDLTPPFKLIPFIVSQEASYVLVASDGNIRVFSSGEYVTDVTVPYVAADIERLNYTQSADVLTIVHPSYPPANLTRTSDTTFSYDLIEVGPIIQPPTVTSMRAPHSGPYNFGYLVTAVDLDGKEESLPSNIAVKHSEGMNENTNRVVGLEWTAPAQPVSRYNISKWGPVDAVTMVPETVWGFIGSSVATTFTDNNIAPDFSKQPPVWGDPFSGGQIQAVTVTGGGSGYDGVSGDWPAIPFVPLNISGDGTGAEGWAVIDHANGVIVSAYLTNAGKNYTTATITANGEGGTGATFTATFAPAEAPYPSCTSYIQQRRVFAGSNLYPETFVMSQPGLYNNFCTTPTALDTDAITATVASQEVNTIHNLVPVSYGLLAFTLGGTFLISGGTPGAAITPTTISIQPQTAPGANFLRPLTVNYDVLYGQAKGNRLRNMSFAWQQQTYKGTDITALAPHLFDDYTSVDWCWSEEPFKLVWVVRSDGRLLSCTYVPEQEVFAWARHDTQGLFRSICSVPEGATDAVYTVVERYVPDASPAECWVYYLERFAERLGCCIFDAWHLDSALTLPRSTLATDLYLTRGEGESVTITSYDPCQADPGDGSFVGSDVYIMEAKENLSADLITIVDEEIDSEVQTTFIVPSQWNFGMGYDRENKILVWSACVGDSDGTTVNDTGEDLWSGLNTINDMATYNPYLARNFSIFTRPLSGSTVTRWDCWSATSTVPNGIGPSTGSSLRFVEADADTPQVFKLVDPRTRNILSHHTSALGARSCFIYEFRFEEDYKQTISPYIPDADRHLEIGGINDDWYLVGDLFKNGGNGYTWQFLPRERQADEVTADYLLSYGELEEPEPLASNINRRTLDSDGTLWFFSKNQDGMALGYKLFKMTMPAAVANPASVGAITDETPWGGSDGPNTGVSTYLGNATGIENANILYHLPATSTLVAINKLYPADKASGAKNLPQNFKMNCTYVSLPGLTYETFEGFVTGFMDSTWTSVGSIPTTGYAVVDCWEIDQADLAYHSYTFTNANYNDRWFAFGVIPISGGALETSYPNPPFSNYPMSNAANPPVPPRVVLARYRFTPGEAPALVSFAGHTFIDEQGWIDAYPTYSGTSGGTTVIRKSFNTHAFPLSFYDMGVWDEATRSWWTSGQSSYFWNFDGTFTPRSPYVGISAATGAPFLRMTIDASTVEVGDCLRTGCSELSITGVVSSTELTATIVHDDLDTLPDDPDGTLAPILAGEWWFTTPAQVVSGLEHLEGKEVWALADGVVVGPLTVADGEVDLGFPACSVVVGLRYTQQIKTLYLTTEGIQPGGTDQGKRKYVPAVTLRLDCTRNVSTGNSFDYLTTVPDTVLAGRPEATFTGDARAMIFGGWNTEGEICVQQSDPLPTQVLGIIVEVTPGDTGT